MKKNKGFTLIELLVVIAIIGILASVVLASLNSARAKGANAAVKSNLANMRAQAEIVYDATTPTQGYGTVANASSCTAGTTGSLFDPAGIKGEKTIVAGVAAAVSSGGTGTAFCGSSTTAWVISVPLKAQEGSNTWWCVDSTGVSKGTTASASLTNC